ncbi:DoxX-like family protein [Brevibacillus humidisoli]|uniref:DoxX-like family protein n=1 Tax=Brevibacillus humidisoli TaxID=2895522 RepID=UPI001E31E3BE|nr:DoxX-like family protein [Brevibacillus humidisoli]UFJ41865.1 DoxX-like family protein [Brevibacillus humidisoli]
MNRKPIFVEIPIRAPLELVWQRTQDPAEHVRWDLRFTNISYLPQQNPADPVHFHYETRLGFGIKIVGTGVTVGQKDGRTSALQFFTDDWKSLIVEGSGSWVYLPQQNGILFRTVYDYQPRYGAPGRIVDRLLFRPLMRWATAWSFDRLRLWLERGMTPEHSLRLWLIYSFAKIALGFVWLWEGLVPKLLFPSAEELALVANTGLAWWDATHFVPFLGVCEILLGLILLIGWLPRLCATASLLLLLFFTAVLPWFAPELLYHPYGALSKNLGLLVCSLIVLFVSQEVPTASRCRTKPIGSTLTNDRGGGAVGAEKSRHDGRHA